MNDLLPINFIIKDPVSSLKKAGLIVFMGLIFGLIVPSAIESIRGTFFRSEIIKLLPLKIQQQVDADDSLKERYRIASDELAKKAVSSLDKLSSSDLQQLLTAQEKIEKRLKDWKPPIYVAPAYPDPLLPVWPVFYICFGILIFQLSPIRRIRVSNANILIIFLGTWIVYRWPTWLRNTPFIRNFERKVYAGNNIDVDLTSFLMQESQALVTCILIVVFWTRWLEYFQYWLRMLAERYNFSCVGKEDVRRLSRCFVRQFIHWQMSSVLLAAAFIPYTYFFWRYVVIIEDQRYVAQAITMHGLWAVSWLFLSMPLLLTWYKWQNIQSLHKSVKEDDKQSDNEEEGPDQETFDSPISMISFLITGVSASIAFLSPIIKALVHA